MAVNLQTTLGRLRSKAEVLLARYRALEAEKGRVDKLNDELNLKNRELLKENETLRLENEYLRIAHNISSSPEQLQKNRAILVQMVRDVDKCISQLKE